MMMKQMNMQMQLVNPDYQGYPHVGGANEFEKHTGFKYGSDGAIDATAKKNKAAAC
ncbi:hypothetical protein [Flavobacterium sp. FlaQc-48]|uniref:hypothetical protein n=1 Tax=Flavobacterium sp. FlaQc-48 TaxID=3374181 RepID=UPI0037576415